jgi:hypothetical protein
MQGGYFDEVRVMQFLASLLAEEYTLRKIKIDARL